MYIIYDLECYPNCFTHTSIDRDTGEIHQFIIHPEWNNYEEYMYFLRDVEGMVGFNNLNYDYALIHGFLVNEFLNDPELITLRLYDESQDAIHREYPKTPEWECLIPQLDLFKIYHFDNDNKRTSLKQLEIAMGMDNVEDLVFPFDHEVTKDEIIAILGYNLNDVKATAKFYEYARPKIELRKSLKDKVWMSLMNANDAKIGSSIFLEKLSEKTGKPAREIRKGRTHWELIDFKEVILDKIHFDDKRLQSLLNNLKGKKVTKTKGELEYEIIYDEMIYTIALGGIHACRKPGIYKTGDGMVIIDSDVSSYYPNLSISNNFYPVHLGPVFCEVYDEIYWTRKGYKKGTSENATYKLALNAAFGKSNEPTSLFFDQRHFLRITLNGQLFLLRLCELVTQMGGKVIMANTDGISVLLPEGKVEQYYQICNDWMKFAKLELEHDQYEKMIIRDVNNYIGVYTNGKVKLKGVFQTNDDKIKKDEWHKNFSQNVVKIALKEYFVNEIPIEDTIRNHKNILDFCKTLKLNRGWKCELHRISGSDLKITPAQKTNRYYVSKNGGYLVKIKEENNKQISVESGKKCTLFNKMDKKSIKARSADIDYNYYILEAEKIRRVIEPTQLKLFI